MIQKVIQKVAFWTTKKDVHVFFWTPFGGLLVIILLPGVILRSRSHREARCFVRKTFSLQTVVPRGTNYIYNLCLCKGRYYIFLGMLRCRCSETSVSRAIGSLYFESVHARWPLSRGLEQILLRLHGNPIHRTHVRQG